MEERVGSSRSLQLNPVTSLNSSSSRCNRLYLRVISRGPASLSSTPPLSPWRRFIHPEGSLYFFLDRKSSFSVVTGSNVDDMQAVARIHNILELVKRKLQDDSIQVPPRCELFLEPGEDRLSCNYYFIDHTRKGLFWLEDVGTDKLIGIPAVASPFQLEKALERLYWTHIESYPMHHESDEQEFSRLEDDLYKIIVHGQADRLASRTSVPVGSYTAEECKEFLKLMSRQRGQCRDGHTLCRGARLAGAILNSGMPCHQDFDTQDQHPNAAEEEHDDRKQWDTGPRRITSTQMVEAKVSMEDIRSNFPHDLTGYVTKSDNFPYILGGFGDIYRGKLCMGDKSIDVAIKTFRVYLEHSERLSTPKLMELFRREVAVLLRLKHPNILQLFGTVRSVPDLHPDIPATVCPWVEKGPLSIYLDCHKNLMVVQRFTLLSGVARGLHYLHSRRVVHGDLSGWNVLVHGDGSACIANFGLSTFLTEIGGPTSSVSHENEDAVRWMAPELLSSNMVTNPTTQSDVYSFGSVMLQTLTGRVPYHYLACDTQVIVAIIAGTKPDRSDQKIVTDVRWRFIQRCWSSGRDKRPTSEEIVECMDRELSGCVADEA